jgi:hypothetical protein
MGRHLFVGGNFTLAGTNASARIAQANLGSRPIIIVPPTNQIAGIGYTTDFTVLAEGSPPLFFQWFFNGTNVITDATNSVLQLANVQFSDSGTYFVVITNIQGGATSPPAMLTVEDPFIAIQPVSQLVYAGQTAVFSVQAGGTPPLNYQWQKKGVFIRDATNSTLTLVNLQYSESGTYTVVITNAFGTATSSPARLVEMGSIVVAWGENDRGQTNVPTGLHDATGIAAGSWHSLALKSDGTVVAWGDNIYGECAVPTNLGSAIAVAAGVYHRACP